MSAGLQLLTLVVSSQDALHIELSCDVASMTTACACCLNSSCSKGSAEQACACQVKSGLAWQLQTAVSLTVSTSW